MMVLKYFKGTLLACLTLIVTATTTQGQDKSLNKDFYIAATIPDSLKLEANSVVRYSSDELIVKGPGRSTQKHHSIVTILNDKDDNEASLALGYDKKFNSVSHVEVIIYNEAGVPIKKYHKSDMYDHAAYDGMSIITDDRRLDLSHSIASYPVTVEISFEINKTSFLDLRSWYIQEPEQAIQFAQYKVLFNPAMGFRYQNKNTDIKPQKSQLDGLEVYTWQVSNLKAFKLEDDVLSWQVTPKINFAANQFQYADMPGDFSTWQNYGKWYTALNADVCTLSPQRTAQIQEMVANIPTDKEKAKFLYEYMQRNMRYVSIQLGIGGLKPFPASFVDDKKYGDCKALSNYMFALLKAVNIPSYYALINSGDNEEPADEKFPFASFNHAILCIPFKGDTTWLECTSNTAPFGKLGTLTENRKALLITENGGVLINTPRSSIADHIFKSEAYVTLSADGSAKVKLKMAGSGSYRDDYVSLASRKTDEQKKWLLRNHHIKQPITFTLNPSNDANGFKELDIDLEYDKFYEAGTPTKQFYRPRAFDLWSATFPSVAKRKNDYYFANPMQKLCTTVIELPEGFEVESLPANQTLKFTYGNYEVQYVYDAAKNQVKSIAKFNLNSQVIPAAKYTEMQQYMDNIASAQNKKLVIHKKA